MTRPPVAGLLLWMLVAVAVLAGTACGVDQRPPADGASTSSGESGTRPKPARPEMVLATTTSTQDSGLLDLLIPAFERATGYKVKVIAVGSGAAIRMGERGDADVLLVHSPAAEEKFVREGFGLERTLVMHNDFVLVGPLKDPAAVRGTRTAAEAMKMVAERRAPFVSRGDNSGTHVLEQDLWKAAGLAVPEGHPWYLETGQGMSATLTVAREKQAYTVSDRATLLTFGGADALPVLVEGDPALLNVYHVILLDPARLPGTNTEGGRAFRDFLVSPSAQKMIAEFGIERYGQPLFFADAGKPNPLGR